MTRPAGAGGVSLCKVHKDNPIILNVYHEVPRMSIRDFMLPGHMVIQGNDEVGP